MSTVSIPEKAVLFLNNLAGDDLWEYGHDMVPAYQKTHLPHELIRYKLGKTDKPKTGGVFVTTFSYHLKGCGGIQLYGFPFLSISVDPFDVDYPIPIDGLIITEDMRMFEYLMEHEAGAINTADPQFSRLAWARKQNMPTVLAVHHAAEHMGDLVKLTKLVGMEIFCPVIWHEGDLDADFLKTAISAIFSEITEI